MASIKFPLIPSVLKKSETKPVFAQIGNVPIPFNFRHYMAISESGGHKNAHTDYYEITFFSVYGLLSLLF